MSYDRKLKEEIDRMGLGDLVHFMNTCFDKDVGAEPFMQGIGYFWAFERLNEMGSPRGASAPNGCLVEAPLRSE